MSSQAVITITAGNAASGTIEAQVAKCPSGALSLEPVAPKQG